MTSVTAEVSRVRDEFEGVESKMCWRRNASRVRGIEKKIFRECLKAKGAVDKQFYMLKNACK